MILELPQLRIMKWRYFIANNKAKFSSKFKLITAMSFLTNKENANPANHLQGGSFVRHSTYFK